MLRTSSGCIMKLRVKCQNFAVCKPKTNCLVFLFEIHNALCGLFHNVFAKKKSNRIFEVIMSLKMPNLVSLK